MTQFSLRGCFGHCGLTSLHVPIGAGLLGVTGSSDLRAVIEAAARGEARAQLGLDMLVHRIKKYIGAYSAVLCGQVGPNWRRNLVSSLA